MTTSVVVGSGAAGLSAALAADDAGASVLVAEVDGHRRGLEPSLRWPDHGCRHPAAGQVRD